MSNWLRAITYKQNLMIPMANQKQQQQKSKKKKKDKSNKKECKVFYTTYLFSNEITISIFP